MAKITLKPGNINSYRIEARHYGTGKPVSVFIAGDTIAEIRELSSLPKDRENIYVAPGLIDNQINGYAGVDFSGDDLSVAGVVKATMAILESGVTSFLPTLITNSHENLVRNFSIMAEACRTNELVGSSITGFHLEGPYISPEDGYRGCHQSGYIRKPEWPGFMEYQEAAEGRIIQVTTAPEIDGAMEFIRQCSEAGIVIAIGHSNANSKQINEAVNNGARLSTHLGNGCANMIHRHNNPIWPQLANDRLTATIICDGNHLLPEEVKVFHKVKGTDNIILTSDVVYLSGMKPGLYVFAGMEVELRENGMLLNISQNVLAGASFPLIKGVENIMEFAGVGLNEAIRMASGNVAGMYHLSGRGELKPGNKADIVLISEEGKKLKVKSVYKMGVQVK
ncbi:MAG TPA: N-acetylglucosamine-6-phosphate deacetylase [Bacteroidales bacterium]|nr:N-acetylglucosamine-6-phosphate deacetylase [Bacteroidales bacterium]